MAFRTEPAKESGQVLVELALVLPLLILTALATVGLAQAGQKKAVVTRAAAYAARVAVVRPDLAQEHAVDFLTDADPAIDPADIKTTITDESGPLPLDGLKKITVVWRYRPPSGFGWRPVFNLRAEFIYDPWKNAIWFEIPE